QMFDKIPIGRALLNSILVASSVTAGVLIFGSMVGYALSRLEFKGRNLIFYIIIFTMTLPFQITLIPQYIIMVKLGWVDTYLALIIPYLMNALSIIMFRQYFKSIPQDLIDAARIDGCTELGIIFRILWPNAIPALVTVGIITFMASWNEVLWPLIVIRNEELMTMPQLVTLFAVGGRAESQLGVKLASATILALPIVLAYLFFQKYFIQSMASTGIKE
ncbi:MAG: carbohydrate ABC transporter permease, partial [Ignavibacteriaceae bacterium]